MFSMTKIALQVQSHLPWANIYPKNHLGGLVTCIACHQTHLLTKWYTAVAESVKELHKIEHINIKTYCRNSLPEQLKATIKLSCALEWHDETGLRLPSSSCVTQPLNLPSLKWDLKVGIQPSRTGITLIWLSLRHICGVWWVT